MPFVARAFVVVISSAISLSALAGNLLSNPDFASDLSGWTPKTTGGGTVTYASDAGSPALGSVHLMASNGDTAQLDQCIALTDSPVDLYARFYAATSISVQTATAEVTAYDQANCAGNPLGFFAFNPVPVAGYVGGVSASGWNEISALNENISNLHPMSALVAIYVSAGAGGTADYYFDDVRFGDSGSLPVKLQSFDVR